MAILDQRETPFGTKPSQLDAPIPGEQEIQEFEQQPLAEAPQIAQQTGEPQAEIDPLAEFGFAPEEEADPLAGFGFQEEAAVPLDQEAEEAAFEAQPFLQRVKTGVQESLARAKVSFGVTDDEKLRAAQSIFPSAVLQGGEIFRRSKSTGNLVPLDPDSIELIDDTLDFARDILEGVSETGLTAIGTAGGAVATGGTGTLPAAVAAGAGGAVAALQIGDFFQEAVLGIERDPERTSRKSEAAIAATFGGAFNMLGSALARRTATKLAGKAKLKKLAASTGDEAVNEVALAEEAIKTVQDSGLAKSVNGDILLTPNQINPSNPNVTAKAKDIADRPEFASFLAEQGKVLDDAYQTVAAAVGNAGTSKAGLGERFVRSVSDINKAEGRIIGQFRKEALKVAGDLPAPVQNFRQFIGETSQALGIVPGEKVNVDLVLDNFPDLTETQAKILGKKFSSLTDLVAKNPDGLPLKVIDSEYKKLTTQINILMGGQAGKPLGYKLIQMKNALRDDWTQAIGEKLGPGSQEAYQSALGKFSKIRGASDKLNLLLKNEDISKEALSKKLFSGQTSLANIRNVKTVIQEGDPDLWKDLVFDYVSGLKNKHTNADTLSVNWQALSKDFDKLGEAGKKELFDGAEFSSDQFGAVIKLGRLTNLGEVELKESMSNASFFKRVKNAIITLAPTFIGTRVANASELIGSFGKDKALAKFLSAGGLDEILKGVPAKKRIGLRNKLQPMIDAIASGAKAAVRTEARIIERRRENQ